MPRTRNYVNRYELDSRLSALEAHMDAKVDAIAATCAQIQRDGAAARAEIKAIETKFDARFSSLTVTLIVTGIATALTVIFGVASFNASLTSNMLSAFQAGGTLGRPTEPRLAAPPMAEQAPSPAPPMRSVPAQPAR
ncbi:hypothetical protein [Achromobacter aloeverae]|uniref:Uncharacterized protein n=1 Tax=Achromobacter aloeverae TaxID=1750518 RepID=A0A4Q1HIJ4_9BURK|nr:hypothetical protein [Achromobacter aloeverae]RXN88044.1 hypothetical protein C7R54_15835 [Achromobacter aloeverae]